jgi:MFS family permease
MSPWWNAYDGNMIGAIGGSAVGILGGCLGVAAGYFAPRGKVKSIIFGGFAVMIAFGAVTLAAGLLAITTSQPRYVWYPLMLIGGIISLVFPMQLPALRTRYRQAELRRLEAEELRRA